MTKFIPKAKMSKKARKELAKHNRVTWDVNPVTRKTENKKLYNRKKNSRERFDEPPGVFLYNEQSTVTFMAAVLFCVVFSCCR